MASAAVSQPKIPTKIPQLRPVGDTLWVPKTLSPYATWAYS
jgi:hypothetical protein